MQTAEEIIARSINIVVTINQAVCAWCHCEYDKLTGEPIRTLSDSEYSKVISHGICKVCKHEVLNNR